MKYPSFFRSPAALLLVCLVLFSGAIPAKAWVFLGDSSEWIVSGYIAIGLVIGFLAIAWLVWDIWKLYCKRQTCVVRIHEELDVE